MLYSCVLTGLQSYTGGGKSITSLFQNKMAHVWVEFSKSRFSEGDEYMKMNILVL